MTATTTSNISYKSSFSPTSSLVLANSGVAKFYFSTDATILLIYGRDALSNPAIYPIVSTDGWVTYTEKPAIPIPSSTTFLGVTSDAQTFVWTTATQPYLVTTTNQWTSSSQTTLVAGVYTGINVVTISADGLIAGFVDIPTQTLHICTRPNLASSFTIVQSIIGPTAGFGTALSISANGQRFLVGDTTVGVGGVVYVYTNPNAWVGPYTSQTVAAPAGITQFPLVILTVAYDGSAFWSSANLSGQGVGVYTYTNDNYSSANFGYITPDAGQVLTGGAIQADFPAVFYTQSIGFGTPPGQGKYVATTDNWASFTVRNTVDNATDPVHIAPNFLSVDIDTISGDNSKLAFGDISNNLIYIYDVNTSPPVPPPIIVSGRDGGIDGGPPRDGHYNHLYVGNFRLGNPPSQDMHFSHLTVGGQDVTLGLVAQDRSWNHLTIG